MSEHPVKKPKQHQSCCGRVNKYFLLPSNNLQKRIQAKILNWKHYISNLVHVHQNLQARIVHNTFACVCLQHSISQYTPASVPKGPAPTGNLTSVWTDLLIFTRDLACDYLLFSCSLNLLTDANVNEKTNKQTKKNTQDFFFCQLAKVVYQSVEMTVLIGWWHHKNAHITKFSTNNYLELCCQRQQTEKNNNFMLLRKHLKIKLANNKTLYVACTKKSEYMAKNILFLAWMV